MSDHEWNIPKSNYTHQTVALGYCIIDATKALTIKDMKRIEKMAEEDNKPKGN